MDAVGKVVGFVIAAYLIAYPGKTALIELANTTGLTGSVASLFGVLAIMAVIGFMTMFVGKRR